MASNKVAGIGAALTAVVGALITLLGSVPEKWQGPVVMTSLFCITVLAAVYMLGSQKWDKLVMDATDVVDEDFPGDVESHPDFDDEDVSDIDAENVSPDTARPEGSL